MGIGAQQYTSDLQGQGSPPFPVGKIKQQHKWLVVLNELVSEVHPPAPAVQTSHMLS